ncbi:MAG: CarD family transcriptional regulator [Firmicutes bacterium]|nr:CarD family transcriptional regulator [Bacillota bacterium]
MLCIGDTVLFGTEGIFVIDRITQKEIGDKTADYYVLKSHDKDNSVIYLPLDNQMLIGKVRPLLTESEICALLVQVSDFDDIWIADNKLRKEKFQNILQSGDREKLIRLAGTIYKHQQDMKLRHRKLSLSDERILKEAERIISIEFAYVLNIDRSDVPQYIQSHINMK